MTDNTEKLAGAISRLLKGTATAEDRELIRQWMGANPAPDRIVNEDHYEIFFAEAYNDFVQSETTVKQDGWQLVMRRLERKRSVKHLKIVRIAVSAAACVLIAAGITWFSGVFRGTNSTQQVASTVTAAPDAVPQGRQGAILTLSDGSKVQLDSTAGGLLGHQGRTAVVKSGNGELKYVNSDIAENKEPVFNILSTPRGRQFRVDLPDGSRVWLNTESSLRFPVAFKGSKRQVDLEGEAYFEVAHDPAHPFFVNIGAGRTDGETGMTIEVLGTSFNAMAYRNEAEIQTTLVDGSVKVITGTTSAAIHPGEAASVTRNSVPKIAVQKVDVDQVVAWKNGMFHYYQTPLSSIMRDIARWYDVDVRYEGIVPDMKFEGYVSRSNPLNKILTILEINNVHFRIEGRTIVVTK